MSGVETSVRVIHAQREEWVTSGQRSDPASAKWVAVDYAGTESCTRGAPPGAGIETASLGSPVPHGIDSIRVAHDGNRATRRLPPLIRPLIEDIVQVYV